MGDEVGEFQSWIEHRQARRELRRRAPVASITLASALLRQPTSTFPSLSAHNEQAPSLARVLRSTKSYRLCCAEPVCDGRINNDSSDLLQQISMERIRNHATVLQLSDDQSRMHLHRFSKCNDFPAREHTACSGNPILDRTSVNTKVGCPEVRTCFLFRNLLLLTCDVEYI